jgi:hypothetical protein
MEKEKEKEKEKGEHDTSTLNNVLLNVKSRRKRREPVRNNPPSLDEVRLYVQEQGLSVDPEHFLRYFAASGWVDSKGNDVLSWKQKLITWSQYNSGGSNGNRRPEPRDPGQAGGNPPRPKLADQQSSRWIIFDVDTKEIRLPEVPRTGG